MDYKKIGDFIAENRKIQNLTQKQLADIVGVTDKAVSKWERGLGCPDVSLLGEISEALDVGIGELLNGEKNENLKDNDVFIQEAVKYSKENTENNIYKKILYVILIFISILSIYLVINNIYQIRTLTNKVHYNFDSMTMSDFRKNYERVKEKIIKLEKLDREKFDKTEDDFYEVYINTFKNYIGTIEDSRLLDYNGSKKLYHFEILYLETKLANINFYASAGLSLLYNYNENTRAIMSILNDYQKLLTAYVYKNIDDNFFEFDGKIYVLDIYRNMNYDTISFDNFIASLNTSTLAYDKVLDMILEVGEINE